MSKTTIKIDVVSDIVCPWCYIGKRRLEKAISQLAETYSFDITYHPFELNPSVPVTGLNQQEYFEQKFGGEESYKRITNHVTQVAAEEGLEFNFDKQTVTPNTRNGHRIIQLAKRFNKQAEVKEAFMKAYFTEGADLSKTETLVAIAEKAGLDRNVTEQVLSDTEGVAEVIHKEKQIQELGITGVPFYIVQNKYGLSGAQPPEAFVEVIQKAALEESSV
ncbi:MAG: DsbA family oxidoreductase [Cyclobacteriaceae bacterium]|nr:DsbA family oxidoreductase [Cyclobacteriaceae bacterium]